MENQRCEQCGGEFHVVRHWQKFCTPKCRDAWHYDNWKREQRHQQELEEAEADLAALKQLPELRKKFDVGMQIVEALKSTKAPVGQNGFRRRVLW